MSDDDARLLIEAMSAGIVQGVLIVGAVVAVAWIILAWFREIVGRVRPGRGASEREPRS